ncbi:MAG: putative metal-binding motif-containing protein [Myxococcota bacterium]
MNRETTGHTRRWQRLGLSFLLMWTACSGDPEPSTPADADGDGFSVEDDCNDSDANIFPGATEICDGKDQDCDVVIDDQVQDAPTWYPDFDSDGFGDDSQTGVQACSAPSGYSQDGGDCDDTREDVNPSQVEVCDEVDQDCDFEIDEDASDLSTFYEDDDADGFGDINFSKQACSTPFGYAAEAGDCDNLDESVYPGAPERCDQADNNCNGINNEGQLDADNNGVPECLEVPFIVSWGFQYDANGCDGKNSLDRELDISADLLQQMGLSLIRIDEPVDDTFDGKLLEGYPLVIYDNGGSSIKPVPSMVAALKSARDRGQALLFVGDDMAKQADNFEGGNRSRDLFDLIGISRWEGNGISGSYTVMDNNNHPVISGAFGRVSSFTYRGDMDYSASADGFSLLMHISATLADPAVQVAELTSSTGTQRTMLMLPNIYAAVDRCPVAASSDLTQIEHLFQNGVAWLLKWS